MDWQLVALGSSNRLKQLILNPVAKSQIYSIRDDLNDLIAFGTPENLELMLRTYILFHFC